MRDIGSINRVGKSPHVVQKLPQPTRSHLRKWIKKLFEEADLLELQKDDGTQGWTFRDPYRLQES